MFGLTHYSIFIYKMGIPEPALSGWLWSWLPASGETHLRGEDTRNQNPGMLLGNAGQELDRFFSPIFGTCHKMLQQWEPQSQRSKSYLRHNLWSHTFSGGFGGFSAVNPLVPVAECLETFRARLGSKMCCQESYVRFLNTHWQKEKRPLHMC